MDKIELVPTKYQSVFSGLYEMLVSLLCAMALSIAASIAFSKNINTFSIIAPIGICAFAYAIYFLFFYPSSFRRIVFTKDGFEFYTFENKRVVKWSDYEGYKVTRVIPYQVHIKVHDRVDIVFGYYAFSASQRKQLFGIFDGR